MNEYLKRGFLLGLGAAVASKEKVEQYIDQLVMRGQIAPKEAQEFIEQLIQKGEETGTNVDQELRAKVAQSLANLGFATQEEVDALKERVEALEKLQKQEDNPAE
jgi:polyhydroxyalkanoate synthesis regulator phasin